MPRPLPVVALSLVALVGCRTVAPLAPAAAEVLERAPLIQWELAQPPVPRFTVLAGPGPWPHYLRSAAAVSQGFEFGDRIPEVKTLPWTREELPTEGGAMFDPTALVTSALLHRMIEAGWASGESVDCGPRRCTGRPELRLEVRLGFVELVVGGHSPRYEVKRLTGQARLVAPDDRVWFEGLCDRAALAGELDPTEPDTVKLQRVLDRAAQSCAESLFHELTEALRLGGAP